MSKKNVPHDQYGPITEPSTERAYGHAILRGLNALRRPGEIYQGTASPTAVAARRRRNKMARVSRRRNR